MKVYHLSVIFYWTLVLGAIELNAQVCESERSAVETCFDENCANCDPFDLDVDINESTQLNELEDAVTLNATTAKDCCPDCSTEVDDLVSCTTPSLCIAGECIGGESGANKFFSVSIVLMASMATGFVLLAV